MCHMVPDLAAARHRRMLRTMGLHGYNRDISLSNRQKGVACPMLGQPLCHRCDRLRRRRSPRAQLTLALALPRIPLPHASSLESVGALRKDFFCSDHPTASPSPQCKACHVRLYSIMQLHSACIESVILVEGKISHNAKYMSLYDACRDSFGVLHSRWRTDRHHQCLFQALPHVRLHGVAAAVWTHPPRVSHSSQQGDLLSPVSSCYVREHLQPAVVLLRVPAAHDHTWMKNCQRTVD